MPRTSYLSNHGIGHVDVGLSREGDHHVIDVVPGLGPHVAYRDKQELGNAVYSKALTDGWLADG